LVSRVLAPDDLRLLPMQRPYRDDEARQPKL
jgi:hypothetical protein